MFFFPTLQKLLPEIKEADRRLSAAAHALDLSAWEDEVALYNAVIAKAIDALVVDTAASNSESTVRSCYEMRGAANNPQQPHWLDWSRLHTACVTGRMP